MARFRVSYKLNPDLFDISSDDKTKMREFVPRRKVLKTVGNIQSIIRHNADVNDFLPPWATEKYFSDLHKNKKEMRDSGALNAESEEIKKYIESIIGRATEILNNENDSLKVLEQKPDIDKHVEGMKSEETVIPKEELEEYIQSIIKGARKIVKSETKLKDLESKKEQKPDIVKKIEWKSEETTVPREELEEYIQSIIEGARQTLNEEHAAAEILKIKKKHKPDIVKQIERKSYEPTVHKKDLVQEYIQGIIKGARQILKNDVAASKVSKIKKEIKADIATWVERKSSETTVCKEEMEVGVKSRTKFKMEEITTYQENLEKKQELMKTVHETLKSVQPVKKLKESDDHYVPRRLFLFNVDSFKEKSECSTAETCLNTCTQSRPLISEQHSDVELRAAEDMVVRKRRTSLRRRILKFLGF
ncbi:uncharacterized protein LOC134262155 [Saccostrea cucullata]|uniref:uncharacterized protein LOC134262155 n=1 Tax=Saccostrea cuccullata TaxID=36930 RepID=UPI002ED326C2